MNKIKVLLDDYKEEIIDSNIEDMNDMTLDDYSKEEYEEIIKLYLDFNNTIDNYNSIKELKEAYDYLMKKISKIEDGKNKFSQKILSLHLL